jgi:hypothetical protein
MFYQYQIDHGTKHPKVAGLLSLKRISDLALHNQNYAASRA